MSSKASVSKAQPGATENQPPQKSIVKAAAERAHKMSGTAPAPSAKPAARKPPVPLNPRSEAALREQQHRELTEALAVAQRDETVAKEELTHMKDLVKMLEEALELSKEHEGGMATLLESLGQNSVTLNGVDWTPDAAKRLLDDEAAASAGWKSMYHRAHQKHLATTDMIKQQEALQAKLQEALSPVAVA